MAHRRAVVGGSTQEAKNTWADDERFDGETKKSETTMMRENSLTSFKLLQGSNYDVNCCFLTDREWGLDNLKVSYRTAYNRSNDLSTAVAGMISSSY